MASNFTSQYRFLDIVEGPSIPPLLVNGETVLNYSKEAEPFNKFFYFSIFCHSKIQYITTL